MKRSKRDREQEERAILAKKKDEAFAKIGGTINRATFDRIFASLSAHQARAMLDKQAALQSLNLQQYFTLRKIDLSLLSQDMIDKVKENAGAKDTEALDWLFGDFIYYLAYHDMREVIQSFTGNQKTRMLKAFAFQVLKKNNVENAREVANYICLNDQAILALAFASE